MPLVITKRLSPQIPADIRQYTTTKSGRGSLLRIPARFGFRVVLKILDLLEPPLCNVSLRLLTLPRRPLPFPSKAYH